MSFSNEEIAEFKVEALELLDVAEKSLLSLDREADFRPAFDAVFRCFHNLKGGAGMMEQHQLQQHTHGLENILMQFKTATSIPRPYIDFFLRGIDAARSLLDGKEVQFSFEVETAPSDKATADSSSASTPSKATKSDLPQAAIDEFVSESDEIVDRLSKHLQIMETGQHTKEMIDEIYRDVHSLKGSSFLFSYNDLGQLAHVMESSLEKVRAGSHRPSPELLDSLFKGLAIIEGLLLKIKSNTSCAEFAEPISALTRTLTESSERLSPIAPTTAPIVTSDEGEMASQQKDSSKEQGKEPEGLSSIRVPVSLLDNLMTLMGEMVLVRNQVLQFANHSEDLSFHSMSKRLNVVTSEIQGEMMKTRLQPIGNVLSKFNRVVRDLSHDLKKNITLNISGAETELDKSLLEAIKDPLTHIVRNACDHGIEPPTARKSAGKPPAGTINIRAYHEGGQVVIEISDDGKGLHKQVLIKKAIEKGIINPAQPEKMTEKEIFNLIFAPGFSTAAQVSSVSGRGVGMDVVLTNIERIGGTVDLSSAEGQGTTIKLKIPLTLAIIPALLVKSKKGHFAIPQVKLEELVRVDQSEAENKVELLHGAPVYRLRGKILPLVDLNQVLGGGQEADQALKSKLQSGVFSIAVVSADHCSFGLIIDAIQDTADIVVKPLNRLLKSLQVYSGATVLGDGSVALILDVVGIAKVARIGRDTHADLDAAEQGIAGKSKNRMEMQHFLLVALNSPSKHALVLGYLHRLEEFKRSQVEMTGTQRVIRYGKSILPLISVNEVLGYGDSTHSNEHVTVIVVERKGKLYGLEVDSIIDTFSTDADLDTGFKKHPGIFGNLNTTSELIVVIDPFEMISIHFNEPPEVAPVITKTAPSLTRLPSPEKKEAVSSRRVLLVEDTVFFRKAIKNVLEKNGYDVTQASDGREALDLLNQGDHHFDIIVSDIEMPRINGFELATQVREHPVFAKIPMLAVSSRADSEHVREGVRCGFDCYLEKLKPDTLLATVADLIEKQKGAA